MAEAGPQRRPQPGHLQATQCYRLVGVEPRAWLERSLTKLTCFKAALFLVLTFGSLLRASNAAVCGAANTGRVACLSCEAFTPTKRAGSGLGSVAVTNCVV